MDSKIHAELGPTEILLQNESSEPKLQEERAPGKVLNTVSTEHSVESLLCSNQSVILEAEQLLATPTVALVLVLVSHNITYRLETTSKLSVEALNELVEQELGIAKQDCLLLHKGLQLCERAQPEVLLEHNSVVYVLPSRQLEGNDILTVNLQKGRTLLHAMNFAASDRVSKISAAVTELFGVPSQHQTLMYCGAPLPNRTLGECKLVNNCRVKLLISPEYKREMSKSCTFNDRKEKIEIAKEPLPQIQQLAKEVQSIEDIDDEIFEEMAQPRIVEPSLEDSFDEQIELSRTIRKKRSTYSSVGDHRIQLSQQKPSKSEAPKLQTIKAMDNIVPGLLQVKQVSSIYNADSEDFEEPHNQNYSHGVTSRIKNKLKNSHDPSDFSLEPVVRIAHFEDKLDS